jgi:hypothetical protein
MKILFGILKGSLAISSFFAMYFMSVFSLFSTEEWDYQVKSNFEVFFFGRLLFTVIAGLIFFLLSLLLNRLFRKSVPYKKKYILFELLTIIVLSVLLVLKTFYLNSW